MTDAFVTARLAEMSADEREAVNRYGLLHDKTIREHLSALTAAEYARWKHEAELHDEEIVALCRKRAEARARRDWEAADAVRDEMRAHGVRPKDLPDGRCTWEALRG